MSAPGPFRFDGRAGAVNYNHYDARLGEARDFIATWTSPYICRLDDHDRRDHLGSLIFPAAFGSRVRGYGFEDLALQVQHMDNLKVAKPLISYEPPQRSSGGYFLLDPGPALAQAQQLDKYAFEYQRRQQNWALYKILRIYHDPDNPNPLRERWVDVGNIDFSLDDNNPSFIMRFQGLAGFPLVVFLYFCAIGVLKSGAFKAG